MSLLPQTSPDVLLAAEEANAERWTLSFGALPQIITSKHVLRPPDLLPYLVYEYGLGMLTPYVANTYDLIDTGRTWMRLRGTFAGVAQGLEFAGATGSVEPARPSRIWWNSAQVRFAALPESEAVLDRVEGITRLSLPYRSDLRRGVHEHDVGPALVESSRADRCLIERESGVRLREGGTLWSFGRTADIEHTLTEAEGLALGNWLAPADGGALRWVDMTYPWVTAQFAWGANPEAQRRQLMARWFEGRTLHVRLMDADGAVIGYRRVRALRAVNEALSGRYRHGSASYSPSASGQSVYAEALTGFGNGAGQTVASAALIYGAVPAAGVRAGALWLGPDDLSGGVAFAEYPLQMDLRPTVRERLRFLLRF
ncbi:phage tail protein [Pannonibacter indicus]|uniref:phage tail protein n=1 Tax=Pannonibacter indicus TaxID=466044 RepID=UPI00391D9BD0